MNCAAHEVVFVAFPSFSYISLDLSTGQYMPSFLMHYKYGSNILGSDSMRNHNVFFDMERYLIRMAESNCVYQELVIGTGSHFPDPYINIHKVKTMMMNEIMDSMCESVSIAFLLNTIICACFVILFFMACVRP